MMSGAEGSGPPLSPAAGAGGADLLTVTVVRDEQGYGMKVSGDKPVYVQSVKERGAAWRAGLRAGDRIMRVNGIPVPAHTHVQVVQMIKASPNVVLTVYQNSQRLKTPITAPVPADQEKQRQFEFTKFHTIKLMLENEQKHMEVLRHELSKVPDMRKQTELDSTEQRCKKLQQQIDIITSSLSPNQELSSSTPQLNHPSTPKLGNRSKQTNLDKSAQNNSTGFLSGLPRSLSNLTGQSLRNLRQARQNMSNKGQQENQPPLERQNSQEETRKRHQHNNTVPMVPVTCLDGIGPPPLPPRSSERTKQKRSPLSPPPSHIPINPLAKPPKLNPASPSHRWSSQRAPFQSPGHRPQLPESPSQLVRNVSPHYRRDDGQRVFRRSAHSLDADFGDFGNGQPNSIAMQMSYPLVAHPQPPIQMDTARSGIPVLHVRSQSSPEHLDHNVPYYSDDKDAHSWDHSTPPPGTPPPPYPHNTQPCSDPQRTIISMEEDDSPTSDNSNHSGLFSNLRSVRESKARTAVLLNWLLGERRCASSNIFLLITDGYRAATGIPVNTLRRWAYEIQSIFVMPHAVLALNGVDENMAREIDEVLLNGYDKEELLRNVFRKARAKAKEELAQQLSEFQVKRQVGLGMLYGPEDSVLEKCDVDKAQESTVVERILCARLTSLCSDGSVGDVWGCGAGSPPHAPLIAATAAAAIALDVRPQAVSAAVGGGTRAAFLQRDKHYKQRLKQIAKQNPQPFIVRGHHLSAHAVTSVGDCHHCSNVIWGLAPQAYVCTDCELRVHRLCARKVEESCCLDGDQHNNRISRFIEKIHANTGHQESNEKKSRKSSGTSNFLNAERCARRAEDEPTWEQTQNNSTQERRDESDESLYESADGYSDPISASDDALPRLGRVSAISKESVKLAVTDEEVAPKSKKGHRKTLSLSNPLEMVRNLGEEWIEATKREIDKNCDKKKSRESLWSEEDKDSIYGSNAKLDERKNSRKEKKGLMEAPKCTARKIGKASSVSALNFLRRKKAPVSAVRAIETVAEKFDKLLAPCELITSTTFFLEAEKRHSTECEVVPVVESKPEVIHDENTMEESRDETDCENDEASEKEEEKPVKIIGDHRRRLSRTTSRSKSKVRGKSQTVRVNTLRKSQSGTLKRAKKKNIRTPLAGRSRNASVQEQTPVPKKKTSDRSQNYWPFSGSFKGEPKREGSAEESGAGDASDACAAEATQDAKDDSGKGDGIWRNLSAPTTGKGVNRAESCREPAASSRRGKQRNASDPNRLTAAKASDCEPGTGAGAPSGSSSSSSLSSRSNESGLQPAEQHASQSDWSEEEEPLAEAWTSSVPQHIVDTLSGRLRKRQEVIHELITSESSHVRWLKVLQTVFLRPLERGEHAHLLTPEELKALFPNLPAVRERHNRLYADLKVLRRGENQLVQIKPLAEAVLNTLGESSYATCLSRFCRGQRMALDALKERRRKNKELHQFLSSKEQLPLCGRLQLKDMLACVWQRLTKYQLLLETVLKTILDEDEETEEDIARLKLALDTAKEVLHSVDMAIRNAENEHRLKSIQSKMEIRVSAPPAPAPPAPGPLNDRRVAEAIAELDEIRRLDLTQHNLIFEGDLSIRTDNNKKTTLLALFMEECLILLHREGEKFILKQMGPTAQLTPIVKWSKVLFRQNAAVKNTFFLMNINGIQMYELSANTTSEYNTWAKYISEAPLAEARANRAPSVLHNRERADDSSGGGVSRNASDASRTSTSTQEEPLEHSTPERSSSDRERSSTERPSVEAEDRGSVEGSDKAEDAERTSKEDLDSKHRPRLTTNGRIVTHNSDAPPPLAPAPRVLDTPTSQLAQSACSAEERLRRLDSGISAAMKAKSRLVGELLGIPAADYSHLADLAVADTLGQVDVSKDLKLARLQRTNSVDSEGSSCEVDTRDYNMHQLLLAAQAQANQLTEALTRALNVTESDVVAARHYAPWKDTSGLCDTCTKRRSKDKTHKRSLEREQAAVESLNKICAEELEESGMKLPESIVNVTESSQNSTQLAPNMNESALNSSQSDPNKNESALNSSQLAPNTQAGPNPFESEPNASQPGPNPFESRPIVSQPAPIMAQSYSEVTKSLDISKEVSFDMLSELGKSTEEEGRVVLEEIGETSTDPVAGSAPWESGLATRLVPVACGLQTTLARLVASAPSVERLRRELARERDANDRLRLMLAERQVDEGTSPSTPSTYTADQSGQDRSNNGG